MMISRRKTGANTSDSHDAARPDMDSHNDAQSPTTLPRHVYTSSMLYKLRRQSLVLTLFFFVVGFLFPLVDASVSIPSRQLHPTFFESALICFTVGHCIPYCRLRNVILVKVLFYSLVFFSFLSSCTIACYPLVLRLGNTSVHGSVKYLDIELLVSLNRLVNSFCCIIYMLGILQPSLSRTVDSASAV